jgi:DNA-binding CsgD family transcriptional regulator
MDAAKPVGAERRRDRDGRTADERRTPQQAAAALGIKLSTARFHLGALFRKTDTRRQAELVRLLLSLPDA